MKKIGLEKLRTMAGSGTKVFDEKGDKQITQIHLQSKKAPEPAPKTEDKLMAAIGVMTTQMVAIAKKSDAAMEMVLKVMNDATSTLAGIKNESVEKQPPKKWEFTLKRDGRDLVRKIEAKEV